MSASILLNGNRVTPGTAATIADLLQERTIDPAHVVVEVNREIVNRDRFDSTPLREGDEVEILRFVGGG